MPIMMMPPMMPCYANHVHVVEGSERGVAAKEMASILLLSLELDQRLTEEPQSSSLWRDRFWCCGRWRRSRWMEPTPERRLGLSRSKREEGGSGRHGRKGGRRKMRLEGQVAADNGGSCVVLCVPASARKLGRCQRGATLPFFPQQRVRM